MRKMRELRQQKFNVDVSDAEQARLFAHLKALAERGDATDWIRQTLIAALPRDVKTNESAIVRVPTMYTPSTPKVQPPRIVYSDPVYAEAHDVIHYEPLEGEA